MRSSSTQGDESRADGARWRCGPLGTGLRQAPRAQRSAGTMIHGPSSPLSPVRRERTACSKARAGRGCPGRISRARAGLAGPGGDQPGRPPEPGAAREVSGGPNFLGMGEYPSRLPLPYAGECQQEGAPGVVSAPLGAHKAEQEVAKGRAPARPPYWITRRGATPLSPLVVTCPTSGSPRSGAPPLSTPLFPASSVGQRSSCCKPRCFSRESEGPRRATCD